MATLVRNNRLLWTLQWLLAAIFLFAGGAKLVMPADQLAQGGPLPAGFLRFVAVMEILGALGLILPGLFRVQRQLTPLAAAGLVVIMIGAVTVTLMTPALPAVVSLLPFCVGIAAAIVAYGRRSRGAVSRPATT